MGFARRGAWVGAMGMALSLAATLAPDARAAGCVSNASCGGTPPTPVCDVDSGDCVACAGDYAQGAPLTCPNPDFPACQTSGALTGACTQCSAAYPLLCNPESTPVCQPSGWCGCAADEECPPADFCDTSIGPAGFCRPGGPVDAGADSGEASAEASAGPDASDAADAGDSSPDASAGDGGGDASFDAGAVAPDAAPGCDAGACGPDAGVPAGGVDGGLTSADYLGGGGPACSVVDVAARASGVAAWSLVGLALLLRVARRS